MSKGYWIATVKITDHAKYSDYQSLAPEALKKYGAKLIVRSDDLQVMESRDGTHVERCVIFEFPSVRQALDCHNSPEYRKAREARASAAIVDIIILPTLSS